MTRFILKLSSLVIVGGFWTAVSHAGTAPFLIPINIDHAVSLNALTRTYRVCATGLDKDVARQDVKMNAEEFDAAYTGQDSEVGTPQWSFQQGSGFFEANFRNDSYHGYFSVKDSSFVGFSLGDTYRFSNGGQPSSGGSPGYAYLPTLSLSPSGNKNTQFLSVNLPYATFSDTLSQAKYDELGNLDQSTVNLADLTLVLPADYQDQKPLINARSSLPSSLKLDFKGFVDCFQSEIHK